MQICEQPEITIAVECRIRHKLSVEQMHAVGWYLSRILMRFPEADLRACASRWMAGKRAITLPGHKRAKRAGQAKRKSIRLDTSRILYALQDVDRPLIEQYKGGKVKALNAIVGKVISITKADPAAVREIVTAHLSV